MNKKAPLVVPASFPSDEAKRDFAMKAVYSGYVAEAKPLVEELVASKPDPISYSILGAVKYQESDYQGAMDAWSKAADLDPHLAAEMKNNIGNALRDTKKPTEAAAAYREALRLEPTRWTAAINLAVLLKTEGDVASAVKVLEDAVPANKDVQQLASLLESLRTELKKAS
ncbi:MAG TPA: tetratricopeptide repeat protein [Symbiobacteriaceae bacterium]|nr:tetratricopeptide repeat protein [Symbiobacteriaceae bacterium]